MILILGMRYRKCTALMLSLVFYLGFLGDVHAAATGLRENLYRVPSAFSFYGNSNVRPLTPDVKTGSKVPLNGVFASSAASNAEESPEIGPTQPESSSFKSAGTDNLVDLFSGNFSYNIPLMDVGGYPVSIHYSSGISMDQEASWVGLGWNLNPGAVTRSMRGLPDDFNGEDQITKTQTVKDNKTVSVSGDVSFELVGVPKLDDAVGLTLKSGVFFNNYMGWGLETGITPTLSSGLPAGKNVAGLLTGSLSVTSNSMYGASISPSLSFSLSLNDRKQRIGGGIGTSYNTRTGISGLQLHGEYKQSVKSFEKEADIKDKQTESQINHIYAGVPLSANISFAVPSYSPSITMPFKNSSFSFNGRVGGEVWGASPGVGFTGTVQKQTLLYKTRSFPAYGYMHYTKALSDPDGLMDFNREKETMFNSESTPHIALPVYTPDVFSISGEGTGGMFRAFRGDLGYIRDHRMKTTSSSDKASVDLGQGAYLHIGTDLTMVDAGSEQGAWTEDNKLVQHLQFKEADSTFENVYFKNPGEQTVTDQAFFAALGNDTLIRASLGGNGKSAFLDQKLEKVIGGGRIDGTIDVTAAIHRKTRDKRTQLISYLTAEKATAYGFNKNVLSYPENVFGQPVTVNAGGDLKCMPTVTPIERVGGVRKAKHISELNVLGNDGKRYVYGIPVYNIMEQDVSFSVDRNMTNYSKGWINYAPQDASLDNKKGKDNYYSNEETPGYAHSFLLTEILSEDYVDIRGDGVTEDDLGDAIRFNYTRVCGENNAFQWRIPYSSQPNMANYNEGLKSYSRDDKGTYAFGKKELWYLNSIESKNFIAIFLVSKERDDMRNTIGPDGGLAIDANRSPRRLKQINLYAKADWVKNGASARPIKSVHFEYDYSLCKGVSGVAGQGKLTLKEISFSFNNGKKKNPYKFFYNAANPDYNPAHYDRWGNYKNVSDNPNGMDNYDYPYVKQDSAASAANAAAWCLTDIHTPGGGKMQVTYESDDYGFVQHKRASRFFKIDGFGLTQSSTANQFIYEEGPNKNYVFATLPGTVADVQELGALYFQDITKLFFKLSVPMPNTDKWGTGKEWIPLYADIESYGLVNGTNNRIWIKVKEVDGMSPFKKVALQFLRLNLPSKAYPNSETGADADFGDMIKVIFTSLGQYLTLLRSFEETATKNYWCKSVDLNQSMVRLNEPTFKRYGGGHRVKKIELFDNWNAMTGGAHAQASYGKEYQYATTEVVNGKEVLISSGVASYEPQIGGDENIFRIAKELNERSNLLAPNNLLYSEEPIGESFFPSPMVGYAKVRVRTIHHQKKSADGWSESTFYTAREFPTLVEMTPLDGFGKKAFRSKITEFLSIDSRQYMNVSQGFKIELNDMHGKARSVATYAETDPKNPIVYTHYYYKTKSSAGTATRLDNEVDVVSGKTGVVSKGLVGKDIEVMIDLRENLSQTISNNFGLNVDIIPGGGWPIPLPSVIPFPQKEVMRFRSSAVLKVVNTYALLDSIVNIDKGSVVSTKNLVWDGSSGQIVLSRANNEFNDPVYNLNYPAYWAYEGLSAACENLGVDIAKRSDGKQLKIIKGKLFDYDNNVVAGIEKYFSSGDEIIVQREKEEDVQDITPMSMSLMSMNAPPEGFDPALCGDPVWRTALSPFVKLWAIDASKGREGHKGIYFIDREGRPYSCTEISEMRVIRSGRRNMMSATAGSLVSLADPVRVVNNVQKIEIDAQTKVLQAGAAVYKDLWKVTNHWYIKDSTFFRVSDATVTLQPVRSLLTKKVAYSTSGGTFGRHLVSLTSIPGSQHFVASNTVEYYRNNRISFEGRGGYFYDAASIVDYDIRNQLLQIDKDFFRKENQIYSATLSLNYKVPSTLWNSAIDAPGCGGKRDNGCIDWAGRTYAHAANGALNGRTNEAYLQNLRSSWGNDLRFNSSMVIGSSVSLGTKANLSNTNVSALNVLSLVSDALYGGGSSGFRLALRDQLTGDQNSSERTQSYQMPGALTISYQNSVRVDTQLCKRYISDTVVNPYRFGILGNWRVDKQFVYYSTRDDRREGNLATVDINLRTDGILPAFTPFWSFSGNGMVATTDESKWTWNAKEDFFNRKGYEMQNHDALDRYNAGQYGYNEQLAVSATQNAKYREAFFSGFEDHDYRTGNCNYLCKDGKLFDGFTVTTDDSHTGLHSVNLTANQNKSALVALTGAADTTAELSIRVDSTLVTRSVVTPKGTGLTGFYTLCGGSGQRLDPSINFHWLAGQAPLPGLCNYNGTRNDDIVWRGKLQPSYTDKYHFYVDKSGGDEGNISYFVRVNGQLVTSTAGQPVALLLDAGKLYDIEITYNAKRSHEKKLGPFRIQLKQFDVKFAVSWSRDKLPVKTLIPTGALYPHNVSVSDTVGSLKQDQFYCVKLNHVTPKNILLPGFAPVKGVKTVVSAWVKIKNDHNNTQTTTGLSPIKVKYPGTGAPTVTLSPTGVRIEGWQRFEAVTDIPANATTMELAFEPGALNLLLDDLRVHPFQSNMKSYVYDPVSLRLMAELDENNYATLYEYDDEGALLRVKKETERGVVTLKEVRSNTQTTH